MPTPMHPKELTRKAVEKWISDVTPKLKRTTSRNDLDRLILSVERLDFEIDAYGDWKEVFFENGKGKVYAEEWRTTKLQRMILDRHPELIGREINRSELREEIGEWILDQSLQRKVISDGGEAIVFGEKFGELEVAVRVQTFDSALFTEKGGLKFVIHLSNDFDIALNDEKDDALVIPFHQNVIRNFCNIEIYSISDIWEEDCIGWITIMEKGDSDLRGELKREILNFEERIEIAQGVQAGNDYLKKIGILHFDKKPANIVLKEGEPKWIDFCTIQENTGRESYRFMGYARRGSKYRNGYFLHAGTTAFSVSHQLCRTAGEYESPIHIFILCDWKTAWSLLFNPLENSERAEIKEELEKCNAGWLSRHPPSMEKIKKISKIISINDAAPDFCLDDPNLTKSSTMADLKRKLTRQINFDFKNVTKNVLNQKESNLCAPISVSVILRWAIRNDLKIDDWGMREFFTLEKIFTILTMIVYPRSFSGFNLNSKKEELKFQENEIELLLKRMKYKTYLNKSGWEIINIMDHRVRARMSSFDFEQVLLHHNYAFSRPLTVTGAYLNPDSSIIFHQMVLDRIQNSEFVIQNTLIDHSGHQIIIPLSRQFYASYKMMEDCYNCNNDFVYFGPTNEFVGLVNECFNMETEKWYLLPQAYSITLQREPLPSSIVKKRMKEVGTVSAKVNNSPATTSSNETERELVANGTVLDSKRKTESPTNSDDSSSSEETIVHKGKKKLSSAKRRLKNIFRKK